jgi:Flp pilus assembly pilin Flp
MVEYSLLVALIGIVSLVAAGGVGQATEDQFDVIAAGLGADSNGENSDQVVEEESGDNEDETAEGDGDADDPQAGDDDEADQDDDDDPLDPQDEHDDEDADQEDDPGDDEDEQGTPGDNDEGDPEPTEEPVVPGSVVADAGSSGSYYWWNDSKHGGEGAWKASVMYQNDWIRHQYLTLEVTRVDQEGNRSTTTVDSFYVPAQGTSNYESWDNSLRLHKGDFSGVLSVEVKVVAIRTSDESWATVSYGTDGPTTVITSPQTP